MAAPAALGWHVYASVHERVAGDVGGVCVWCACAVVCECTIVYLHTENPYVYTNTLFLVLRTRMCVGLCVFVCTNVHMHTLLARFTATRTCAHASPVRFFLCFVDTYACVHARRKMCQYFVCMHVYV
eukprot:GDKI01026025.1.p1 GENE.GDKI01026025.1~~GDKI01026025.1.p1  ORF type:complete len:127 (-),score=22.74 GDKI01026025.1:79-459(-)